MTTSDDNPTEAMVRREIAAARRILREDRILAKLGKHFPDEPPSDPGAPPPDKKDPPGDPTPVTPKKGLWWGDSAPA
jgi:hypothetical protein